MQKCGTTMSLKDISIPIFENTILLMVSTPISDSAFIAVNFVLAMTAL